MAANAPIVAYLRNIFTGIEFFDAEERPVAKVDFPNSPGSPAKLECGGASYAIARERSESPGEGSGYGYRMTDSGGATVARVRCAVPEGKGRGKPEIRLESPSLLTMLPCSGFFRKTAVVADSSGNPVGSVYEPSFFSVAREFVVDFPDSVPLEQRCLMTYALVLRDFFATNSVPY